MGLVDQKHRQGALARQLFHVLADREEDITSGGAVGDAEGVAKVAVEIAATEGNVVAVRESKGLSRAEGVSQGAQYAGLTHAGLTGDDGMLALVDARDEVVDDGSLAVGQP